MAIFLLKLKLIVWKNFLIRKRHKILTVFEILMSVVLFLTLGIVQTYIPTMSGNHVNYVEYHEIDEIRTDHISTLLYVPNTKKVSELMEDHVAKKFIIRNLESFTSENLLLSYVDTLKKNNSVDAYNILAIIFDDFPMDSFPKNLKYRIRADMSSDFASLFPSVAPYYSTMEEQYKNNKFLSLQYAVDTSFIELSSGNKSNLPVISVQKMPFPPHDIDNPIIKVYDYFLPFCTVLSFVLIFPSVLKRVIEEKASGIKELMKMMGLQSWMVWLGWFIHSMVTNIIAISFIVAMLKIPLSSETEAIFNYANGGLIWLLMFLYCVSGICYSFAVSTLFSRPTLGMCMGLVFWNATFFLMLPLADRQDTTPAWVINLSLLLPNTCLLFAIRSLTSYEHLGGQTISNLWTKSNKYVSAPPLGQSLLMLFVDSIIFLILTWYIDNIFPGNYGTRRPWYFPVTKSYWFTNKVDSENLNDSYDNRPEIEKHSDDLQPGVQIRHLRKKFNGKYAVDGLNLDIYNRQITVLLGHNGAGKTTTMNIITGMLSASSGTVLVDGYNISTNLNKVRESLGLCPQHNLQFPDLTVLEHLIFFAMLKGRTKSEAKLESLDYLSRLHLTSKANKMASALSGGMRRKLSLGMALVGKTKVLMLDEPTSGLDPEARREIWDFLLSMRGERTILITTHYMEEADILGDRIAIMHHGTLMCYGTSLFLKKYYGTGYTLSVLTKPSWDLNTVTTEIKNYVPSAIVKSIATGSVVFSLPTTDTTALSNLFLNLEHKKTKLNIANFGVSITSLEDVFLKVGELADEVDKGSSKNSDSDSGKFLLSDNSTDKHLNEKKKFLIFQQFYALIIKRLYYTKHNWIFCLLQALIPIIMGLILFIIISQGAGTTKDIRTELTISKYSNALTFYSTNPSNEENNKFGDMYKKVVESQNSVAVKSQQVSNDILNIGETDEQKYHRTLIAAAEINTTQQNQMTLNAMYGGYALYGMPISLNLLTNTLLKLFTNDDSYSISVTNNPFPAEHISNADLNQGIIMIWVFQIPLACTLMVAFFIGFPQSERMTGVKHLQIMSGVPRFLYWIATYIFDLLVFFIVSALVLIILIAFDNGGIFGNSAALGALSSLIFLYGMAVLPFAYLMTYRPTSASSMTALLWIHILIGTIASVIIHLLQLLIYEKHKVLVDSLNYLFLLVPNFAISDGMSQFATKAGEIYRWNHYTDDEKQFHCEFRNSPCCVPESKECKEFNSYYAGNYSIEKNVIALLIHIFLYWGLLLFIDSGLPRKYFDTFLGKIFYKQNVLHDENNLDYDVNEEKKRVRNQINVSSQTNSILENEHRIEDILLVSNLKKYFGKFFAVRGLNFGVKKGECFGLLGINGAGKTTTFKMLTGDIFPTTGYANILGTPLNQNKYKYLKQIGYCPQFDALNLQLTTREMLTFFATIKGIPYSDVAKHVNKWLRKFDIMKYENIPCGKLSGGNKRKLSTAIALIGDPPLIMLDEPTSGVDPVARRNLWDILSVLRKSGQSIILTSHSMDECEALCDRLGIMVDGQLKCLGNIQYLKNKYGQGFTVMVKLRNTVTQTDEVDGPAPLHKLKNTIENKYVCLLKDEHTGMVLYHVTSPEATLGEIFAFMESVKQEQSIIEDYAVSDTSLEQVFLSFAKDKERVGSANVNRSNIV